MGAVPLFVLCVPVGRRFSAWPRAATRLPRPTALSAPCRLRPRLEAMAEAYCNDADGVVVAWRLLKEVCGTPACGS